MIFSPIFLLLLLVLKASTQETFVPQVFFEGYKGYENKSWEMGNDTTSDDIVLNDTEGDISVVTSEVVEKIILGCHANYPIYWIMSDVQPESLSGINLRMKATFDDNDIPVTGNETEVQTKGFFSYLILENLPSLTGLYTCRSVENVGLSVDKYVYLVGGEGESNSFTTAKSEIQIGLNGNDSVTIPCKVTKKDVEVKLSKEEDGGNFASIDSTTYDPRKGFLLEAKMLNGMSLAGNYECRTVGESNQSLTVKVLEEFNERKEFAVHSLTDGSAGWKREESYTRLSIECCSNSSEGPDLVLAECHSKPHCEMLKKVFSEIEITPRTDGVAAVSRKRSNDPCVDTAEFMTNPVLLQCKGDGVDIEEELIIHYGPPPKRKREYVPVAQNDSYVAEKSIQMRILRLVNETDAYHDYERRLKDATYHDIFEGDKIVFECCGAIYFHAIGRIQWIKWKNGSTTRLKTPEGLMRGDGYPFTLDYCDTYFYYSEDADEFVSYADLSMDSFECVVPLWDNSTMVVNRMPLRIKVRVGPEVAYGSTANLTFDENQYGLLKLDCVVVQGSPAPVITWWRDGYKLNQSDKYWSLEEHRGPPQVSTVLFMRAVKEIDGEYECVVENDAGSAKLTFNVKVRPRSYVDYWVALAVFGGFFALIICCALRISTMEKQFYSNVKVDIKSM